MADEDEDARMAGSDEEGEESSESDDESLDVDGGASDRDLAAVMALEQSLQSHPADYGLHAQYVALLRRCKLRGRLRGACEAQAALFPLTEQQWRDWIDDEIAAAERCGICALVTRRGARKGRAAARALLVSCASLTLGALRLGRCAALRTWTALRRCTSAPCATTSPCRCGRPSSRCARVAGASRATCN